MLKTWSKVTNLVAWYMLNPFDLYEPILTSTDSLVFSRNNRHGMVRLSCIYQGLSKLTKSFVIFCLELRKWFKVKVSFTGGTYRAYQEYSIYNKLNQLN